MKKIINAPHDVIGDYIDALTMMHLNLARVEGYPVVVRGAATKKSGNKVALVSGGGSGHEPAHAGFVGPGMLDGAVLGAVFTSPSVDDIFAGIRAVATDAGVLLIVKNYTGDRLNFGLAAELARAEGIAVEMVIVDDDCALGEESRAGRRGLTGTVLVHKLAGAAAERGWSLEKIATAVREFIPGIGTMGVAIGPCYVPGALKPNFELGHDEVEWGLGIHGEPGKERGQIVDSRETAKRLVSVVVDDRGVRAHDKVVALANGLGGTPDLELQIFGSDALAALIARKIEVERLWVGNFITSLETPGVSVTVAKVNSEQLELLSDECEVIAFPRIAPQVGREADVVIDNPAGNVALGTTAGTGTGIGTATGANIPITPQFTAAIATICDALISAETELTDMDREVGDGDLGVNLARGARAVLDQADVLATSGGQVQYLRALANIVRAEVGGTSGPLYSLFVMGLADALSQSSAHENSNVVWTKAAAQGLANIQTMGGAEPGDCTMVDALHPAVSALSESVAAATTAAEVGAEHTREIRAGLGRSSYIGERAIGHADPGAVAVAIQFRALRDSLGA